MIHNHWISQHIPLYHDNNDIYKQHLVAAPDSHEETTLSHTTPDKPHTQVKPSTVDHDKSSHPIEQAKSIQAPKTQEVIPNLQIPHDIHEAKHEQPSPNEEHQIPHIPHPHHPYHVLQCPHDDLVTFWEEPTKEDIAYRSPYLEANHNEEKYVTFEPGKSLLWLLHIFQLIT